MDLQAFYTGQLLDAHQWLGAKYAPEKTTFRTFAPSAQKVELLLESGPVPMQKTLNGQFYEVSVDKLPAGTPYEYRIYARGSYTDHCDPYGNYMERRPDHRSITWDMGAYKFADDVWMKTRTEKKDGPLNIYEIHAGSFKKPGFNCDDWYSYPELGRELIPYMKECGYNFVEFLPLCEHPSDESWGYQQTGYFAPTSRYGNPDQLKELIDMLHANGIGAIIDFVPVHFAMDSYGLSKFDGSPLYEYPNSDVGMSEWGTCNFMHSRGEVKSFLQSSANFWLSEYHFDGIRMDAISRIIFWQGDERRGVNGNALDFVKYMNSSLKKLNPGCMLIAEDSTSFKGITKSAKDGGLGFDYKWDLGWMHDTLDFFRLDPKYRPENYHKLTFSMLYFGDENYLLPLSHDEVVHMKGSITNKMYGTLEEKLSQAKALYMYMMIHPGKKLNFMGNELGQFKEWIERYGIDFDVLQDPRFRAFHDYMKKLNNLYLENPAFYEMDYEKEGFEWADCGQESRCIYAIIRRSKKERLLAVFNLSGTLQKGYSLKLKDAKEPEMLLCSEAEENGSYHKTEDGLEFDLPPFSAMLLKI